MNTDHTISTPGMIQCPFFLIGAERSGSTVLRLMLDHHPEIAFQSEFEFSVDWVSDTGEWPSIKKYRDWLKTHRIFLASGFHIDTNLNYPELINDFLRQKQHRAGKPIVGATVHRHFAGLLNIWPDARFIYLLRDGRDVARSCIQMGWAGNMWTGCREWMEIENLFQQLKRSLPPNRYIEVKFEDLIRSPEATLRHVCQFMGVSYHGDMLSYPETTTYAHPNPNLVEQWRRKLKSHDIRLAEARIGPMLARRGYPLSGLKPYRITKQRQRLLMVQDRIYKLNFRLRRYGPGLVFKNFIARRFHQKQLLHKTIIQMNEIETAHLK